MINEYNILQRYKSLWRREKFYNREYDYKDKFIFKLIIALDDAQLQNMKMRSQIETLEIQLKAAKKDAWELQKYIVKNMGVL